MRFAKVLSCFFVLSAGGLNQAQEPEGNKTTPQAATRRTEFQEASREPVAISAEVKEVAEETLPMDLQISEATRKNRVEQYGSMNVVQSSAQELGLRIFAFTLAPKERLKLTMSSLGDNLWMNFLRPATPGVMRDRIQVIEQKQSRQKLPRLEFQNESSEPFTLFVRIIGPTRVAYKLGIDR